MQQHGSKYFVCRPPPDPGDGVNKIKIQLFQNMVMLHIILNGLTKCSNMIANILPADPPHPRGQKVIIQLFLNNVMLHIKLFGITSAATW